MRPRGRSALAAERAEWLRRPAGTVPPVAGIDRDAREPVIDTALSAADDAGSLPSDARSLLEAYGIPLVPERVAGSLDEAVAAARELGFPVAVKTAAPGVHKTETGGVALGPRATRSRCARAVARIGCPVIVQPMVERGIELLAGVTQDPVFGPLVAFGPGGAFAELIGDAGFRIAPLTDVDARELVATGKAGKLVRGYRGAPPPTRTRSTDLLAPALAARRGPSRGGRARPQPGDRRPGRMCCGRCARAHSCAGGGAELQDLVMRGRSKGGSMVDAMRSPAPGRELVRLGRRGGRLPMPGASVSGRRGEAQARWRPAPPAATGPERPRRARSRSRTREIVASAI